MDDKGQDIAAAVAARKAEEESLRAAQSGKGNDGCITSKFINDCLDSNERGDGALFAALHRGRFVIDKNSSQWYLWTGHYWKMDTMDETYRLIEEVSVKYLGAADNITPQISKAQEEGKEELKESLKRHRAAFYVRAKKLRSVKGAQNCLTWAHRVEQGLGVHGEEFDRNPWLLAVSNGVVDLHTGRFREGRPEDMLTKASPHAWTGIDTPAPAWERFLNDVFTGDNALIDYVRRLFGYGITGIVREHIFAVLHGEGRNGKGTLVETLRYVLGDAARPIQSELLLDQKAYRSSSGPSPDIMGLKGLRIAFATETDEGRRFSSSKVKWLSGGDTLIGRNPHDKHETAFRPTHLLCLLTNHLPHAPGDEFSFWQRLHLIPFKVKFVDEPKAPDEKQKIKDLQESLEGEASGILAWLVRGCVEWQKQGLNPPLIVRASTEDYRLSEDLLSSFLTDRCQETRDERVQFKLIYDAFVIWFVQNIGDEKFCPKKKKFSQLMEKRFEKKKVGGHIWFNGLSMSDFENGEG
ncbi:MAG: phage/plasmid primase, P4 family [Deltaproteobacteria bacterium]